MHIPFVDLKAQYETIKEEIDDAIQEVLDSTAFSGGVFVQNFEEKFARFCQSRYCIGVGSGTEALWLVLLALGIGAGDEVITVSNTFIATAEAITYTGATPVFVDVEETYYTMNPGLIKEAITPRTKAIIPVHLFGQMADMDPIIEIAGEYGLYVVEDACQAHGATYCGKKAGSIGIAGAFSFYPGKNLGAYGEAGAVTTNDEELANKIRMMRDHGQSKKYFHESIGWNARMDGIQGAVLSVKLEHLEEWTANRRENAGQYDRLLANVDGIITPHERQNSRHVYHLYVVRVQNRDAVIARLREREVATGIHYPIPVHRQTGYIDSVHPPIPVTERCADELLSLPVYAEMSQIGIEYVCDSLVESTVPVAGL